MSKIKLIAELYTDFQYDTKPIHEKFIQLLLSSQELDLTPSHYGQYEPARMLFEKKNLNGPLKLWNESTTGFVLRKSGSRDVTYNIDIDNSKTSHPSLRYIRKIHIEFRVQAKRFIIEIFKSLLRDIFEIFHGYYLCCSCVEDITNQTYAVLDMGDYTIENNISPHPEQQIPGMFWINLVSKQLLDSLGRVCLEELPEEICTLYPDGSILLMPYTSPENYNSLDSIERKEKVIAAIGSANVFRIGKLSESDIKDRLIGR